MSTPVIEHIAVYMLSVIDGITVKNGYNYDLVGVRPTVLEINQDLIKDKNVLMTQDSAGKVEVVRGSGAVGDEWIHQWAQPFYFHAMVFKMASDVVEIETKLNQIRSDIEKAFGVANLITSDVAVMPGETVPKRANGKADGIEVLSSERREYKGFTLMVTGVTVEYSVKANDPYTVR